MTAPVNLQFVCRRLQPQFIEKDGRHVCIKVLAGVYQHLLQAGRLCNGM